MTDRTTVIHLTTVHNPFDTRIFLKECRSLAEAGYDVVLAQRTDRDEIRDGVRIRALPTYGSRLARMTRGVWRAWRIAREEKARIAHLHDIELLWAAPLLRLSGVKVIYDAHEDVAADLHDKQYLPGWSIRPLSWAVRLIEYGAGKLCSRVVAATGSIERNFARFDPVLLRNVPILGELAMPDAPAFTERDRRVIYVGGMAPFNGVEQMIRAMGALPPDSDIRLTLGGRVPSPKVEAQLKALPGADRVDFIGFIDRKRLAAELANARAGLVIYQPSPNIIAAEPNKFFEVLSAGLPLIASDYPLWRGLIEKADCGEVVEPTDIEAIAAAIRRAVDDPAGAEATGARGKAFIQAERNWSREEHKLIALYESALAE